MKNLIKFHKPVVEIKEPIAPGSSKKIEWSFDGDHTEIVGFKTSCGCTASVSIEPNKLTAIFTDDKVTSEGKLNKNYTVAERQQGFKITSKSVTLFLKDDKPLMTKQGMNWVHNMNKLHVVATFTLKIDLTGFPEIDTSAKKVV
jgi:hypothetical protein